MGGERGAGEKWRWTPSPQPLNSFVHSFIAASQCRPGGPGSASGLSNPCGWVTMTTACCCSYHGCCCWRRRSDAGSSFLLAQRLAGGLPCRLGALLSAIADSAPNSGTSDALGHSGTGGVGEVEEVLLVVVVVVRSRYQ